MASCPPASMKIPSTSIKGAIRTLSSMTDTPSTGAGIYDLPGSFPSEELFAYDTLPSGPWIRILELRPGYGDACLECTLRPTLLLHAAEQYDALSYVWGPESPEDMLKAQEAVVPPTSPEKDKYEWGVGEEADLITFSPLFDPDGTTWFYAEDVTGYNTTASYPNSSSWTSRLRSRRVYAGRTMANRSAFSLATGRITCK